jgi:hypothetical protein
MEWLFLAKYCACQPRNLVQLFPGFCTFVSYKFPGISSLGFCNYIGRRGYLTTKLAMICYVITAKGTKIFTGGFALTSYNRLYLTCLYKNYTRVPDLSTRW